MRTIIRLTSVMVAALLGAAAYAQSPDQCPAGPSAAALPKACTTPLSAEHLDGVAAFLWAGCQQLCRWPHDAAIRQTGPKKDGSGSVHGYVSNFYAPSVYDWLKRGRPAGGIPDGAMIVKQMYNTDANNNPTTVSGWTIIVKDKAASFDGWNWGYVDVDPKNGWSGRFFDPNCVACHGSADGRELTYAALDHVGAGQLPTAASPAAPAAAAPAAAAPAAHEPHAALFHEELERRSRRAARAEVETIPDQDSGIIIVPTEGPTGFVTSDVCSGCHDASNLAFDVRPNMAIPADPPIDPKAPQPQLLNLSPFAEWGGSMMALSGRDPVFQAQLESEKVLHPELADFIDDTCYSCHGAMGQRQLHQDKGLAVFFTHAMFMSDKGSEAKYGGLGRDGISCEVCHRMVPEGMRYTGKFNVGTARLIFGPDDKPADFAMKNAVGMTPQKADLIREPRLCGTCHVVETAILAPNKKYTVAEAEQAPKSHEQSTYFEWLNSAYRTGVPEGEGAAPKRCQDCHMPQAAAAGGAPLVTKIANIEDETYKNPDGKPFLNTAPLADITLEPRQPFSRHTFVGDNVFVMEMFRQFPQILGIRTSDRNLDYDDFNWIDSLKLTIREAALQAASATARLGIGRLVRAGDGALEAPVSVRNLAGHKFPSGVGFRRAFIEFVAYDAMGGVVWSSGRSSDAGVLLDGKGKPLPTEFSDTVFEPHHEIVDSDSQAQIYEERIRDTSAPGAKLTTSFLALADVVKDNRLMPKGWREDGPNADATMPVGVEEGANPGYYDGSGSDRIVYRVPAAVADGVASVKATLYSQTIPPYYLAERERVGGKRPATERLKDLAGWIKYQDTPAAGWKLPIASAERAVGR